MAIARAIVSDPTLLVCDEPTGDLDRATADEILRLLQMLNREHGKTIVMVTHDPKAAEYAQRRAPPRQGHAGHGRGAAPREVPAAALGAALPQEDAHGPHAALDRGRLPALRPAAGRAGRVRVGRRRRRRQAPAHHRALLDHRAAADVVPAPHRAGAGRGGRGLRRLVRRQVPEREQCLPGVRGGSRPATSTCTRSSPSPPPSARPSPGRAPGRSRASVWSTASAGRSARSCRSPPRSTRRPTAA